jgi:hypothetical protein
MEAGMMTITAKPGRNAIHPIMLSRQTCNIPSSPLPMNESGKWVISPEEIDRGCNF